MFGIYFRQIGHNWFYWKVVKSLIFLKIWQTLKSWSKFVHSQLWEESCILVRIRF